MNLPEVTGGQKDLTFREVERFGVFKAVWRESGFGFLQQGPHTTYSKLQDFVNQLRDTYDSLGNQTFVRNMNDSHFGNPDIQFIKNAGAWTEVKRRLGLYGRMYGWWA